MSVGRETIRTRSIFCRRDARLRVPPLPKQIWPPDAPSLLCASHDDTAALCFPFSKAMARDLKLNVYQHTPKQLRKKIEKYAKTLEMIGAGTEVAPDGSVVSSAAAAAADLDEE